MKKISAILLTLALIMSLAACGDVSSGEIKQPADVAVGDVAQTSEQTEQPQKTEATPTGSLFI